MAACSGGLCTFRGGQPLLKRPRRLRGEDMNVASSQPGSSWLAAAGCCWLLLAAAGWEMDGSSCLHVATRPPYLVASSSNA